MQLPAHKHDIEAIEALARQDAERVRPLLPQLLTWVQDMNWPVAEPTAQLLLHYPNELTPLIADVLAGTDWDWQYWCLKRLVPHLPFYAKMALYEPIARIAAIDDPYYIDYAEAAQEALQSL